MKGWGRPTEGTDIWEYFFGTRRDAVEPGDMTQEQERIIYEAVAATEKIFRLPFVNKTIDTSVRVRALAKIFPSASFIQMKRDPVDVVQSIYRIRLKKPGQGYFGARPQQCRETDGQDLIEQVCRQVYYLERNLAYDRSVLGDERFLSVSYRNVCADPRGQVRRVAKFMNDGGAPARVTRRVPPSFERSHGKKVDGDEYDAIRSRLRKLYGSASVADELHITT